MPETAPTIITETNDTIRGTGKFTPPPTVCGCAYEGFEINHNDDCKDK